MSSEMFCLKWSDFQQHIVSSYQDFREDSDFYDVTLVSEGNQEIEAHRIILTACSPFFRRVLRGNKNSHPMIFMRGVNAINLAAVVDFIYYGEVNIYQRDLDGFLALATDLKLKGLESSQTNTLETVLNSKFESHEESVIFNKNFNHNKAMKDNIIVTPGKDESISIDQTDTGTGYPVAADTNDLKLKLDSMMEKVEDEESKFKCSVCGKITTGKHSMRKHIETHIDDISYPCNQCNKVSRSSDGLRRHISREHHKKVL